MKRKTAAERAWERHEAKPRIWCLADSEIFLAGYRAGAKLPSAAALARETYGFTGPVNGSHFRQLVHNAKCWLAAIRRLRRKS